MILKKSPDENEPAYMISNGGALGAQRFLGLEIDHVKKGLFLCQQKYTRDLLQRFSMVYCKSKSTPIETNIRLKRI